MKTIQHLFTYILIVSLYLTSSAQDSTKTNSIVLSDTILKLNGELIISKVNAIDSTSQTLFYHKPSNTSKLKALQLDNIYSITTKKGEQVIYTQDTLGNDFSRIEMKAFIQGEHDARTAKYPKAPFLTNLLLSSVAGLTGSVFSPLIPIGVSGAFTLPSPKVKQPNSSIDKESYINGYQYETKRRRKLSALLGGGIGLVGGLISSIILEKNGKEVFK